IQTGNRAAVEEADGPHRDSILWSGLKLQASVLSALLSHDPEHPLAGKLVTELLARRAGGTWRTTQDSAFALLAIEQYWRALEPESPRFDATVWVGEEALHSQPFRGRSAGV